ncbi:4Fe-4S binding protein [Thermoanaerobacterium thermosaccharolyticum]|uniref:4Fe-4S binding protein n=1 Tax=Thermoanaerobacterium thermosaccharolyticum TaxID=1517 RepID=UPI003DA8FC69
MVNKKDKYIFSLKAILWTYIIMCIIIAGLNYGYASKAPKNVADAINWIWQFYENWIKTIFIIAGSFLTINIIGKSKRTKMRKANLIGLIIAALIVHVIMPLLFHNGDVYFFAMPLPWTTVPLQLLYHNSSFYKSYFPIWGVAGISSVLIFYVLVSIIVFIGTFLYGRRWQCSTICLFNGFASEVFDPVFPLLGKKKHLNQKELKIFTLLRWLFFAISLFLTTWWILFLSGVFLGGNYDAISKIESYKYLAGELLMAMFFWIALTGRGYCYYCPLGTVLGLISKIAGQKITTNNSKCIQCGQCNESCPMSIDIKSAAYYGKDVADIRCVGCGHCVDACPTKTLSYTTKVLSILKKRSKKSFSMHV